jgi:hypothetical protein
MQNINPTRMYLGICEGDRASLFLFIRVFSAIYQRLKSLFTDYNIDPEILDPYWTVVSYYNSLKELGTSISATDEDIINRLNYLDYQIHTTKIGNKVEDQEKSKTERSTMRISSKYIPRIFYEELNSNCSTSDVKTRLKQMETGLISYNSTNERPLDLLLSSNMLSVGIDVSRLGLMIVNGQPMNTSEYIQATSRVGRSTPGLIILIYRRLFPRDRSYFEKFDYFHGTMYQFIEKQSSTPYSIPVRQRTLHAQLIGLLRHLHKNALQNENAANLNSNLPYFNNVFEYINSRINASNDLETVIEKERALKHLKVLVEKLNNISKNQKISYRNELLKYGHQFESNESLDNQEFHTMGSMRAVDTNLRFRVCNNIKENGDDQN